VAEVCEEFWRIERELKLLDVEVLGINVWSLLRMPLYYQTTTACGFFDSPHPNVEVDGHESISDHNNQIWDLIQNRKMMSRPRRLWLKYSPRHLGRDVVITHGRTTSGVDIYTQQIIDESRATTVVFDRTPTPDAHYPDLLSYRLRHNREFSQPKIGEVPIEPLQPIFDAISILEKRFGVDLSAVRDTVAHKVAYTARQKIHYVRLFKGLATNRLFITNTYFSSAIVAAAKECNIRVIELQHGFISRYHLGYSYPDAKASRYLPDEMWCFGQFWIDETGLDRHIKTRVIGAPYIKHLAAMESAEHGTAQRIIVTSQGAIGQHLLPVGLQIAENFPESEVIFRLHPSESLEDMQVMLDELTDATPNNFVLNAKTPNIFALMKSADINVGVFSTTLLEGMALGIKTVIIALPGFEYMDKIVQRGDSSIAMTPDEVVEAVRSAKECADPAYYYAEPAKRL
jgi:hypothetical protein